MPDPRKPHPLTRLVLAALLVTFFGGGLLLFVNLFVPFLNEGAQAIIGGVVLVELVVGAVVGKCMQAVSTLRRLRDLSGVDPGSARQDLSAEPDPVEKRSLTRS